MAHHFHHQLVITVIILIVAAFRENCFVFGGGLGGGRQFVSTRFINSPLGIGISSALKDTSNSSRTRTRSHSRRGRGRCDSSSSTNTYVSTLFADTNNDDDDDSEESCLSQGSIRNAAIRGASETDDLRQIEIPTIKVKSKLIPIRQKWGLPSLSNNIDYESNNNSSINDEELDHLEKQNRLFARPCAATKCTFDATRHVGGATTRGGTAPASIVAAGTVAATATRSLMFWENMLGGAISRSVAQTVMHPANTMKTILQSSRGPERITFQQLIQPSMFKVLTRGAGANFILSVPHGAVNFAVLEMVRARLNDFVSNVPFLASKLDRLGPALDFTSSAVSTICCSVVSTPQMMITDNIMAGNYPKLMDAIKGLYTERGIAGFYAGWWPGLVGKIPSYALTWTFFQQLKRVRDMMSNRPARNIENTIMGCIASGTTVCIMIPLDTIKTRLVTQMSAVSAGTVPYKGIVDCAVRMAQEEGIASFYRGLAPRLISVVPMIGIQFGVYEFMKNVMLQRRIVQKPLTATSVGKAAKAKKGTDQLLGYGAEEVLEEAAMETAASGSDPFPAPHFHEKKK